MKKTILLVGLALAIFLLTWKLFHVSSEPAVDHSKPAKRWAALARGTVDVRGGLLQISAPRDGIVESVAVEEGQSVATGQILATQDGAASRLAVEAAAGELAEAEAALPVGRVRLEAAEREMRRLELLATSHLATNQEVEQARDTLAEGRAQLTKSEAAVATQRVKLEIARNEQALRSIRSPIDGIVVHQNIQVGEAVNNVVVAPLFSIAPSTRRIVRAEIEEDALSEIKVGQSAEIVGEMDPSFAAKARVARIGLIFGSQKIAVDEAAQRQDRHVVECILELENDANFLLGQRVLVRFLTSSKNTSVPQ